MTFVWSWALPALVAIPIAVGVYVWRERRRRKFAVRYSSLALIREARPGRARWRRHIPFALLLVSAASLMLAVARPQRSVAVPTSHTSIILTLDVSRSMCSTDVEPNRLTAAERAARTFIRDQPSGTRIGIVAFAGVAEILVAPTRDTAALLEATRHLGTAGGTAIGSGLLAAIDALAGVNVQIAPSTVDLSGQVDRQALKASGLYEPDVVVLLTDGANTRGVDPLVAAGQAADRRVRVFTIGFGTTEPGGLVCTPDQIAGGLGSQLGFGGGGFGGPGGFGGGGFGGGGRPQALAADEKTLQAVADATGGEYFQAESAPQLERVFRDLPARVTTQVERHEVSVLFVGLGALVLVLGVGLSLWWNRFP